MTEDRITTGPPRRLDARQRVGSLCAGAAVVMLTSALLLAVKSRLSAMFGLAGEPPPTGRDVNFWQTSSFVAVSAFIIAMVLLWVLWSARRQARAGQPVRGRTVMAPALCALAFLAGLSPGLPTYYHQAMTEVPLRPALPTAVGAWILAAAGAAAVVCCVPGLPLTWRRAGASIRVAGVVVGLVISIGVSTWAVHAGDDSRLIDATTAAAVDVPPYPSTLGQKRFTIALPEALDADHRPLYDVRAAGAGFIVVHNGAVTAYGAEGTERWHYRRAGGETSGLDVRVYDNGATVIIGQDLAGKGPALLVALDAMTGEQLWQRRDAQLLKAFSADSGLYEPGPYLIYRDDATWTRFDARTGRTLWSVPNPGGCPVREAVDTLDSLASLVSCEHGDTIDRRIVFADPGTGNKTWDHSIFGVLASSAAAVDALDVRPWPTGQSGVYLQVTSRGPTPSTDFYIDTVAQQVVALPDKTAVQTTAGPDSSFLVQQFEPNPGWTVLSVYGSDGRPRCTTTTPLYPSRSLLPARRHQDVGYVSLREGVVFYDFNRDLLTEQRGASSLHMISNTTCRSVTQQPFDAYLGLIAAPGAVLAVRQDFPQYPETVLIEGYA